MLILNKANINDCKEIHDMQVTAFKELFDKYQDIQTNPGAETIEQVIQRMQQDNSDYYFITLDSQHIGVIRILRLDRTTSRVSPMFILPNYQGKGYAQQVIKKIETMYPMTDIWELDTIKQEFKLCHLYEKMGYVPTGQEKTIQDGMTIVFYEKHLNR